MDVATRKNRAVALRETLTTLAPLVDRMIIALSIAEAEGDTDRGRQALERADRYEAEFLRMGGEVPA